MCRVWMCKACGQTLPEGLRCFSIFGMMLLLVVAALTLVGFYIQNGMYFGLFLCYCVAVFGFLLTYGGIRVCSPTLICIGTLFHFALLALIPAALYWFGKDGLDRDFAGNAAIIFWVVLVSNAIYGHNWKQTSPTGELNPLGSSRSTVVRMRQTLLSGG